jgi:segregation and condensation protein A
MAAWLAFLKSRLLIPASQDAGPDPEASEVAEALADQIRRMTAMEEAATKWLALPQLGRDHFVRGVQQTVRSLQRPAWVEGYFDFLMTCTPTELPKKHLALQIAPGDLFSVEEAIGRVEAFLATRPEWAHLEECLPIGLHDIRARSAVASHLVASLELCRQHKAEVRQDEGRFGPIWLRRRAP